MSPRSTSQSSALPLRSGPFAQLLRRQVYESNRRDATAHAVCDTRREGRGVDWYETELPALNTSPGMARAFLREALKTWNLDGLGEVTEVLTTELVTNVVR